LLKKKKPNITDLDIIYLIAPNTNIQIYLIDIINLIDPKTVLHYFKNRNIY